MKINAGSAQLKVVFAFFVIVLAVGSLRAQSFSINTSPLPSPTGFVNDYAGVIDAATKQQLEQKIKDFKESSNPSVEIGVAVVRSTGERDIFDYSLAVARGWKIGSKDDDNPSALLLVAVDDRKYFTQVSKDLEDELPDGVAGSLQRQYLVPEFRKGNYGKGISDTVDAYIATIRNKGNAAGPSKTPEEPASGGLDGVGSAVTTVLCIGGILLILLVIIISRNSGGGSGPTGNDRSRWGGGGGFGGSALPWIIGGILGSGGGGSSSGGSDWGSSGGGGSDWGGFGGGGDFGGGGAGGSW